MHKIIKRHLALITVITLILLQGSGQRALAGEMLGAGTSPEGMIVDFLLARPLGIAATAAGTVFFIASLPFSALGGNTKEAAQTLVGEPVYFTFQRPLGHF